MAFEQETSTDDDDDLDVNAPPRTHQAPAVRTTRLEKIDARSRRLNRGIDQYVAEAQEVTTSHSSDATEDSEHYHRRKRIKVEGPESLDSSVEEEVNDGEAAYKKFKARKSVERKKAHKSSRRARAVAAENDQQGSRKDPKSASKKSKVRDYGDMSSSDEELMEWTTPDYVQRRRQLFDERTDRLRQGGLQLPPSYDDVYFSDDNHIQRLTERPSFSHLAPCAPYRDVQLPYSLGLIPASIAQWLREYQVRGAAFLHELFVYQKGGILGDDMGLGKTVQVIAFLSAAYGKTGDERDHKRMRKVRNIRGKWYPRTLIICPGSLMSNWKEELDRWGWWHTDFFHGSGDKEAVLAAAQSGRVEIVITTYHTYKANRSALNLVSWDCVVADECHLVKERKSQTAQAMNEINALCRIGLTGTAIQNKYEELWTLLNWINPGQLGPISTWKNSICLPLKLGQSHNASNYQLARARKTARKLVENLLPRFFLRRMKTLIKDQLPKKSDRVVFCPLTDVQAEAYENFVDSEIIQLIKRSGEKCDCESGKKRGWCCHMTLEDGTTKWQSLVFPAIATLQKLANHLAILIPQGNDPPERIAKDLDMLQIALPEQWHELNAERDHIKHMANPEFCGKWRILKKLLKFWHDEEDANNKVLVFSHSVRLLKMLQSLFVHTSFNVSYLDGSMKYEERYTTVRDFNTDPNQFVFLVSTKAGGVGLNITSANKVVVVDPNWNPSYDLQAQDRAYRIGQTRDVEVFRLVSQGTIEEIVYARQIYKQQQASIGYSASNERRYFQGVQDSKEQKGEIFGLQNLFMGPAERDGVGGGVLREIVNKTNVAESRADIRVVGLEIGGDDDDEGGQATDETDHDKVKIKTEDDKEDAAMSQLVAEITGGDDTKRHKKPSSDPGKAAATTAIVKHDPVSAILAAMGVQYTHENSEVIGSSKVEARLSKRAEMTLEGAVSHEYEAPVFPSDSQSQPRRRPAHHLSNSNHTIESHVRHRYRPPPDVQRRQFCSMAKWAGYENVVEFALVVEGWTQSERREWLTGFYRMRRDVLLTRGKGGGDGIKEDDDSDATVMAGVVDGLQHENGNDEEDEAEEDDDEL